MRLSATLLALAGCWRSTPAPPPQAPAPTPPQAAPSPPPSIRVSEPTMGNPDRELVWRYVQKNRKRLRGCYEAALAKTPGLTGKVTASFTIGGDGKVTSSTASGLDPNVDACVADAIKTIEFPRPTANSPITVSYPILFQAD